MRWMTLMTVALCATGAMTLAAQQPGPRRPRQNPVPRGAQAPMPMPGPMGGPDVGGPDVGGPVANPAEFLLAHTGDLKLSDAQVTRLAAIARRTAERRQAMRASMDSLRRERGPATVRDSASRAEMRQRMEQMRPAMERLREQAQADRRDAIAVLTPDQQAQAWERVAMAARGGRGAGFRPGRMRAPMGGAPRSERRMRMRQR